jgi:hypothetical protein
MNLSKTWYIISPSAFWGNLEGTDNAREIYNYLWQLSDSKITAFLEENLSFLIELDMKIESLSFLCFILYAVCL